MAPGAETGGRRRLLCSKVRQDKRDELKCKLKFRAGVFTWLKVGDNVSAFSQITGKKLAVTGLCQTTQYEAQAGPCFGWY